MTQFRQNSHKIYLASTVWHELVYGISIMAEGKRKQRISQFFYEELTGFPFLDYDQDCAGIHATIRAKAKILGHTLTFVDSQIASIALANNMTLVTRNTKDFINIDSLKLENWFDFSQ